MDSFKYDAECEQLHSICNEKEIQLKFDKTNFEPQRLNCLWYGGNIATLSKEDITIDISAIGDVRAKLFDINGEELVFVKDKGNNGRFYDEMNCYIKNDNELETLIEQNRLVLDNNNWIEFDGIINNKFIDLGMIYDNITDSDNILEAIEEVIERFDEIVDMIQECITD